MQFGLDYGVNNSTGQVSFKEIQKILSLARSAGVDTIDTATAYGNSESLLGAVGLKGFKVVTKLPPGTRDAAKALEYSKTRLMIKPYGWMYHSFEDYRSGAILWEELQRLQEIEGIEKIGFSLYLPEEWEELRADGVIPDILQVPYNLFDRRFEIILGEAKAMGVEVHTRSCFLQGLFFRHIEALPNHFSPALPKISLLHRIVRQNDLDLAGCLMNFVLKNPLVDRLVFGVDSFRQFHSNLSQISDQKNDLSQYLDLADLVVTNEEVLNPAKWPIP